MLAVEKVDNVRSPCKTCGEREHFCIEVAQLIPGHPSPSDERFQKRPDGRKPTSQVCVAVGSTVQQRLKALWIEMPHKMDIAGPSAPVRKASVLESNSNWLVNVAQTQASQE